MEFLAQLLRKIFCFLFFFSITSSFAQNKAEFSADTTRMQFNKEYSSENLFIINGQKLSYGSRPVFVEVDPNKLDTILFRTNSDRVFDTIVCNIKRPDKFKFYYNECCGGFNLKNETIDNYPIGKVLFKTIGNTSDEYIGKIGNSAIYLSSKKTDTIVDRHKSAVMSNVDHISIWRVEDCDSSDSTCSEICIEEKGPNEVVYFKYPEINKVELIKDFLYLPLDETPLKILFDLKKKMVTINHNK